MNEPTPVAKKPGTASDGRRDGKDVGEKRRGRKRTDLTEYVAMQNEKINDLEKQIDRWIEVADRDELKKKRE